MPHHHTQHAQNVGPNLLARYENSAYLIPRVTTHAVMTCVHHAAHAHRQASRPMYTWHARHYLWMCHLHKLNDIYQK